MGHVLRRHARGRWAIGYWLARPLAGWGVAAFRGDAPRRRFFGEMLRGRWEGWTGRLAGGG